MARMIFPDGKETTDFGIIEKRLAHLGVTLRHWPAPKGARAQELMDRPALDDAEFARRAAAVRRLLAPAAA